MINPIAAVLMPLAPLVVLLFRQSLPRMLGAVAVLYVLMDLHSVPFLWARFQSPNGSAADLLMFVLRSPAVIFCAFALAAKAQEVWRDVFLARVAKILLWVFLVTGAVGSVSGYLVPMEQLLLPAQARAPPYTYVLYAAEIIRVIGMLSYYALGLVLIAGLLRLIPAVLRWARYRL